MSIESTIVTLLLADATLVATLTGGILSKQAIGKKGIDVNNPNTPNAYTLSNQKYVLRPVLVVRLRSLVPQGNRHDVSAKHIGAAGALEFWLYAEDSYTALTTARDRIYTLLHAESITSVGVLTLDNRIEGLRAEELNNAALLRDDYRIRRKIGV